MFIALMMVGVDGEQFYWTGLVLAPISADLALSDIFRLDHLEEKLHYEYPDIIHNIW